MTRAYVWLRMHAFIIVLQRQYVYLLQRLCCLISCMCWAIHVNDRVAMHAWSVDPSITLASRAIYYLASMQLRKLPALHVQAASARRSRRATCLKTQALALGDKVQTN